MHPDLISAFADTIGLSATHPTTWYALRRFEQSAIPIITEIWELDQTDAQQLWMLTMSPYQASAPDRDMRQRDAYCRLHAVLGADLGPSAAACTLNPLLWQAAYERQYRDTRLRVTGHLLTRLAHYCLVCTPFPQRAALIAQRIIDLALTQEQRSEPGLAACLTLLIDHEAQAAAPVLDALSQGDMPTAWAALIRLAGYPALPHATPELISPQAELPLARFVRLWQERGAPAALPLLRRLHQRGQLDQAALQRLLESVPAGLTSLDRALEGHTWYGYGTLTPLDEALRAALLPLFDTAVWPMVRDLRPETWDVLQQLTRLRGGHVLVRMVEALEQRGITRLPLQTRDDASRLLRHLLSITQRHPDDDDTALAAILRDIDHHALIAALPHAPAFTTAIASALGWQDAIPLIATLRRIEQHDPARSLDPTAGVIAADELRALAQPLTAEQYEVLCRSFHDVCPAGVTFLRAALGENRSELRRQLGRRKLLAARALGLLPITDAAELRQRYLLLARFRQESSTGAVGRRPYERAAAEGGLRHLALAAGYSDVTRLEWAMEAAIGSDTTMIGRTWQIEGYHLTLELRDGVPALGIANQQRRLKRRPSVVTRDYAFREVQATLEAAQAQSRRYRDALLDAMRNAEPLSPEELALLRGNPIAAAHLERLVLIDQAGALGLYQAGDDRIEGRHGERVHRTGAVTVAHPYDLARLGILEAWQTEIVRRQIVQPFKQVFREVYVLTPAEQSAGTSSGRLAGRQMRGRQAAAVLATIGWVLEGSIARKTWHHSGIVAEFETGVYQDYGYQPNPDEEAATTGTLRFRPRDQRSMHPIPLQAVPALVFSEALRDLDMVTAVAHADDEGGISAEILQRRGDLVRSLSATLGLRQVTVGVREVQVHGSLSSYRISLVTGAIYLAHGQYLCIVPGPIDRKAIYVPYAESGEPLVSEIVSKVLLLSQDSHIRDESILSQITAFAQAAA